LSPRSSTAGRSSISSSADLSSTSDSPIRVWDLATGRPLGQPLTGECCALATAELNGRPFLISERGVDIEIRNLAARVGN
jgi:hypothetical protein